MFGAYCIFIIAKLKYTMTNLQENPQLLKGVLTHLIVLGSPFRIQHSRLYVIAKCKCGTLKLYSWKDVKSAHVRSCGCLSKVLSRAKKITHGDANTPLYNTWCGIKARCYNKKSTAYFNYGARGIKMYAKWKNSYAAFKEWAIKNGWKHGLQIDRKNNNKGYYPNNCRVTTQKQNSRNRRNNIKITHNGKTKILVEWVEFYGLNYSTIMQRYIRGLRGKALFQPFNYPSSKFGRKWKKKNRNTIKL